MQTSTTAALGALAAAVGFRIYRYATRAESPAEEVAAKAAAKPTLYEQQEAELQHFSGLLFGGSLTNTCIEWGARAAIIALGVANPGGLFTPRSGCQGLVEVGLWMCAMSVFNRGYNSFLEYAYARNPQYRTQPPLEHALRQECDLVGRELSDLKAQDLHDRMTLILDALTTTALMAINPGFFPGRGGVQHGVVERGVRLLLHQYTIAFTMYWAHRAGHVTPFKWHNIHGAHHQATHPLSRVTYQAHCWDNWMNQLYGHTFAQYLMPLDHTTFYVCYFLRIMESLEKHSGLSCHLNFAHNLQRFLPYSQMPHHHDLHHEGSKRCNFTFSAGGGLWDAAFGTRKAGRAQYVKEQATTYDLKMIAKGVSSTVEQEQAKAAAIAVVADGEEITLGELALHKSAASRWVAIGGGVYDVTEYMREHPGGEKVLADVAGRDATVDYEDVGHTDAARARLAPLKIGSLAGAARTAIKSDADSWWNGLLAVHSPVAAMSLLVALSGQPGGWLIGGWCLIVLAAEISLAYTPPAKLKSN